ncbi:MAG: BlaI/MecI/CopY family transcriptional regulator [Planctomycetaceae bacterium]|nr:BlaI/MecI/CopY family transcriptional regulator [Planctomycetaceae bacterium]
MTKKASQKQAALSPLENAVMGVVWEGQPMTAEAVRERMEASHKLKDSTVRTLLRRLEAKGYVEHDVDGRTFIYRAAVAQTNVAASAVRSIVDKFCAGSVENLLVGLVDDKQISPERLQELANQIAAAEAAQKQNIRKTGKSQMKKKAHS